MSANTTIKTHIQWLNRGSHRLNVLDGIGRHDQRGDLPDQVTLLTSLKLTPGSSAYENGRLAIMGLIERGFVLNDAMQPRKYALRVNWEHISVYSDWLEEHGKARLDVEKWQS